ncbi:uncharacterized protein MYCFIDRAFT_76770 [Pseudocercospora fijiensis CIRAD86]|uniref:Uncharacterized protein n=1 Tax=Pseudocercospora fijiensis (strain CIRAD86) TaxID=383855 RepID=N1QCX3_PSEFD|nr:uncharacterized protein MYCFIDRAFT_76770 [Pseudocercospora fijiensis CIRAD86]EME89433.1 hypothetical protein MYCFIDRAFT_76770 [Pseudocercospora fijiensis CIRAD86]
MSKYVPPGRRRQSESSAAVGEKLDDHLLSLEDIRNYFWPVDNDAQPGRFAQGLRGTLNDSAATPGRPSYIVLFAGANPRWDDDHIIFTKSSLDLLPAPNDMEGSAEGSAEPEAVDDSKDEKNAAAPIAVFKQGRGPQVARVYEFDGWYQIERVQLLEPKSPELVRMLEQKWSFTDSRGNVRQKQRDAIKWNESLGMRWAVLKLRKDEATEKERGKRCPVLKNPKAVLTVMSIALGTPKIEKVPDTEADQHQPGKKSVNEMLAEMRMDDESGKEAVEASTT